MKYRQRNKRELSDVDGKPEGLISGKRVNQSLGDVPAEEFQKQLHELADWIADYREHIAEWRIAPNDKPGAILAQLDRTTPETAVSLDEIFADIERVIVPGVAHWAHPQFMSYFGCTTTSPGILAEMITGALNVNAMTWRTSPAATELETLVLDWLRQWRGLRHRVDFDDARSRCCAGTSDAKHAEAWLKRAGSARSSHLHVRSSAQF